MERCLVCGDEGCDGRTHPHTGPLQRCLGGKGLDWKPPARTVPGRKSRARAKKGPAEDRAVHGPVEDRAKC